MEIIDRGGIQRVFTYDSCEKEIEPIPNGKYTTVFNLKGKPVRHFVEISELHKEHKENCQSNDLKLNK